MRFEVGVMSEATMRSYHVVLEPDQDGGYVAVVPAFPGCYSQGDTVQEALANARDAIALTVDDMRAHGEPIPDPSGELIAKVAVGA
jgi:predicted RNase H-like HicB family nuclease